MESSEDDAGNATSASCRASAREKDIGLAEDVEATRDTQHEPPETSPPCRTPAMSEDNFDGDSVPSPTAQDVNTSTEAILDMIDEFVDGPGAPKRLPLSANSHEDFDLNVTLDPLNEIGLQQTDNTVEQHRTPSPSAIDKSEVINESTPNKPEECKPHTEESTFEDTSSNFDSQLESSVSVDKTETSNQQQTENNSAVISVEPEALTTQSMSESPSSSVQSVQNISNISVCEQSEQSERTIKCVTSSDKRDSVTVERAESTSSECSVSESKSLPVEPLSRSPLKRRLVRPAPSDRRPDSTVSSTVDTQTVNIEASTSCDVVVKDVSSSSDAVPLQHGNVKPEEISKVSEISICKAETSTAPKKIRLVRPKVTPALSNSVKSSEALTPEKEQCQSTSSDDHASPIFPVAPTTSRVEPPKCQDHDKTAAPVNNTMENVTLKTSEEVCQEKENDSIGNETTSSLTSSSSESSTLKSGEMKSSAEEAPSEIQLKEAESSLESKKSEPINTESNLKPTKDLSKEPKPTKIKSKESEPTSFEPTQETKCVGKTAGKSKTESTVIESKEPAKVQSTEFDSSAGQSQESTQIVTKSIKGNQSTVTEPTEVKSEEQVSIKSQVFEPTNVVMNETPSEIQSKVLEPTPQIISKEVPKSQPIMVEPTQVLLNKEHIEGQQKVLGFVEEKSSTSLPNLSEPTQEKPIKIHPDVLEQVPTQSKVPSEKQQKLVTPTPTQSVLPKKLVEPTPITLMEDSSECPPTEIEQGLVVLKEKPTVSQPTPEEPAKSQPSELDKSQVQSEECTESQSGSSTTKSQLIEESPTSQTKVVDPIQVASLEYKAKEIEMPTQIQPLIPKVKAQSKLLKESQPTLLQVALSQSGEPTKIQAKNVDPKSVLQPKVQITEPMEVDSATKETELNAALVGVKKQPPIKLTLSKVLNAEKKVDDLGASSISKNDNVADTNKNKPEPLYVETTTNCDSSTKNDLSKEVLVDQKRVPPIKLNLTDHNSSLQSSPQKSNAVEEKPDSTKQVPKLTIKLGSKQTEEIKSPIPKLTIKPIRPPTEDSSESSQQIPSVTKLNIKPIVKPQEETDNKADTDLNDQANKKEQIPSITKLNIKAIPKPPEKINDMHRKSSSSEISESEYSENDETSTSDQASASDQGPSDTIPKVTIRLGKPGTESEGKFYTEKNIPKLTIKGLQQNENEEKDVKLKLVISQSEDTKMEKIPKLTIKTKTKSEGQPLSPKLTIKPVIPSKNDNEIPKLKISTDTFSSTSEVKENMHVPKITIKAVTKTDSEATSKTPKKSSLMCDSSDHIPIVTKLNIKPIMKPIESEESSDNMVDKVPTVSKLNIKPIVKPKDNEVDCNVDDVPKVIKLNIKPLKNPEESASEEKDCDENVVDMVDKSIPVVTKLNIKPIVKPEEDESLKDSENQSSETGTSSDDNSDHIPVVTKLNIKPIVKPTELVEINHASNENIPVVTKLNIKPLVKPEDNISSPKRESLKSPGGSGIPTVTKLNIKPIVKPEDSSENKIHDENVDKSTKNPPLLMKINMKNVCDNVSDQMLNSLVEGTKSPRQPMSPKIKKSSLTPDRDQSKSITSAYVEPHKNIVSSPDSSSLTSAVAHGSISTHRNCLPEKIDSSCSKENISLTIDTKPVSETISSNKNTEMPEKKSDLASPLSPGTTKQKKSLQNCTLLKQLLSNTKDDSEKSREMSISNCIPYSEKNETALSNCNTTTNVKTLVDEIRKHNLELSVEIGPRSPVSEVANDLSLLSKTLKTRSIQEIRKEVNESVTKPLEIITDKVSNQSSGQDSPRIILKINKTDHGSSAKIITEECHKFKNSPPPQNHAENTHESVQEKLSPKKHYVNSRKKLGTDDAVSLTIGKRLRSSKVVETPEKLPAIIRRNPAKRSSVSETSPTSNKESELSVFDTKRLKLEQILSVNKGLTITPVASNFTQTSLSKPRTEIKPSERKNHSLLNNDNSKNGNSKLHNILSSLQAKQRQSLQLSEATIMSKDPIMIADAESNTSTGSSDVIVEISRLENCHPDVQEMIINENSDFRDLSTPEEISQDPLEVDTLKNVEVNEPVSIKAVEVTPTPRKRGRPRKIPLSEGAKPSKPPTPPVLPISALEERPQRSLRLMRERPAIIAKPRGRGRGRGGRRAASPIAAPSHPSDDESSETLIVIETLDDDEPMRPVTPVRPVTPEDPTSSRIKLPRMTEALDKSTACITPLSSRRRSVSDMKLFGEPSVVIESPVKIEEYMKSPDTKAVRGRGSRGGRGTPRGRTPRGRGRGRGGGKGATYMKETMGIYGRVCGPATTTVELFEEETCMMDDNATPSKPSHLLDEDSQSSVKSSTNDSSNKMKKSKFADLFDSNKVWTASDVKEYTWPPHDVPNVDHQVTMIQEQVAMFLGVKSFKRRYSELKRRAVVGDEKDYCLRKGIVTEALCDLGITAVDASDVLDIMLSDYPHKYEEYRSYQRQRQLTESIEEADSKLEEKAIKIEFKSEKTSDKPEPPKVDPEKTRQDMAAAAIASAAEWNAMANAWRRPACVDLQSNTIHRRRPPPTSAPIHCRPPHGFYPHAILPGQYQHTYRVYTPDQLRYFPLNTVIAAPPAPPSPVESSSESEGTWVDSSSSSEDSHGPQHSAKRKKLTKVKRSSQQDKDKEDSRGPSAPEEVVDLCRVCKLRLEANRKYTHERFLVCAQCNSKYHPNCLELSADTIRKCREYPWQCAECKSCCSCEKPAQDDKMLFCDLCDRGVHKQCVGLAQVPSGRWHCVECAVCKSCGARDPGGPAVAAGAPGPSTPAGAAEWHHQTRRGPGGHKVYSHSLCTPCARAYRIGRYCPLCERSFIGPKGTMQLVICKLCDRQLHQECVRPTVSALNVMDYTCADCRRGGITSRAGAVRAAPRTIATLFMAKRRFNKYAHKQYMQSRQQERDAIGAQSDRPDDASDPETCPEASDPLEAADSRTDFD